MSLSILEKDIFFIAYFYSSSIRAFVNCFSVECSPCINDDYNYSIDIVALQRYSSIKISHQLWNKRISIMYSSHSSPRNATPYTSPPFITKRNFRHSCVSSKVTDYLPPDSQGYHRNSRRKPHFFLRNAKRSCSPVAYARGEERDRPSVCTRGEFRGCCAYACIRILPHFLWDSSRPISIKRGRAKNREKISSPPGRGATEIPSSPLPSVLKLEYLQLPLEDIVYTGREVFLEKIE